MKRQVLRGRLSAIHLVCRQVTSGCTARRGQSKLIHRQQVLSVSLSCRYITPQHLLDASVHKVCLPIHLRVIDTDQSLLTTQGCNESTPEAGHKAWVTIREHTFGHAMAGHDCCNEQSCIVLHHGSAFTWHKVSILCQVTYKGKSDIIALQCHRETSNPTDSYILKNVSWCIKEL